MMEAAASAADSLLCTLVERALPYHHPSRLLAKCRAGDVGNLSVGDLAVLPVQQLVPAPGEHGE